MPCVVQSGQKGASLFQSGSSQSVSTLRKCCGVCLEISPLCLAVHMQDGKAKFRRAGFPGLT